METDTVVAHARVREQPPAVRRLVRTEGWVAGLVVVIVGVLRVMVVVNDAGACRGVRGVSLRGRGCHRYWVWSL